MADTARSMLQPGEPASAAEATPDPEADTADADIADNDIADKDTADENAADENAAARRDADAAAAADLLADLVRRIAVSLDLRETLQVVAQAVVDHLGFGAAAVNIIRPDDMCEAAAIAGPAEAVEAMLGAAAPAASIRAMLAACEHWGELRFLDHRKAAGFFEEIPGWTPPMEERDEPGAWHPEDELFAPMNAPDGTLIGLLSVDLPTGGRHPGPAQRRLLEQFATHAAVAIDHARIHTLISESEQLFRAMFDRSPIAIALMTEDRCLTRVNPACVRLLGRDAAKLVGRAAPELSPPDGPGPGQLTAPCDSGDPDQYEVHFTRPDGSEIWGRVNSTPLVPETRQGARLILVQVEDITQLRSMQARFAHAATHDQLTGLANRALVLDRLTEALTDALPREDRIAVLFCDVDHFKEINDTLGHAAGDQLLAEIGRRLALVTRAHDIAGRFGGDEFVVIAYPVPTPEEGGRLADRVLRSVCRPVELDAGTLLPSLSIGAALSAPDDSADSLVAAADRALYAAKAGGRGQWQLAPDRLTPPGRAVPAGRGYQA
jgi:diguanylate cyclase (GGDEF)-like protein/PAS domain S-box-containing protein